MLQRRDEVGGRARLCLVLLMKKRRQGQTRCRRTWRDAEKTQHAGVQCGEGPSCCWRDGVLVGMGTRYVLPAVRSLVGR